MYKFKNIKELKNISMLILTIIILIILIIQPTLCAPTTVLEYEQNISNSLQIIEDLIDNKKYKDAINKFDQLNINSDYYYHYNKIKYNKLLKEYKSILLLDANTYTENGEYVYALNILKDKLKYYKNDENILNLIAYNENQIKNKNLVEYNGEIEHLFTHCLLAFPDTALNPKNSMAKDFDRDCLTPNEFKKILLALYNNNYVLVDINSVYEVVDGICKKKTLYLPPNKKPLIFSFDDCNYDSKKRNKGMVDKIILDRNNNFATYTSRQSIQDRISYDNEFIPILENFIKSYPDFSHNGAKGLICLTGYDGILGYRTQKSNATSKYEIKKAKEVVNALKKSGWQFACHSYGHYHMKKLNDMEFAKEVYSWQDEVESIIGKTNIYVYPYGEWEVTDENGNITYKHQLLLDSGFNIFCGVGSKIFFNYVPIGTHDKHTLFMDRKAIDGRTLRQNSQYYSHLFNCEEVYDHANRTVPYYS